MKNLKLQSAMEYLMTYGWAILIIAVVMVVIFSLGVFNPSATGCLHVSGYLCSGAIYSSQTGGISVTVGEQGTPTWVSANILYFPSGVPMSSISTAAYANAGTYNAVPGGLVAGQTYIANVPVVSISSTIPILATPAPKVAIGTTIRGQIYAQYQTVINGPFYFAQLATITIKAS